MQKSKDITKYNLDWQITRVNAIKYKDISQKINYVLEFYEKNKTIDNHERVLNWLDGLSMGYKDPHNREKVLSTKKLFEASTKKEPNSIQGIEYDVYHQAKSHKQSELVDCFKNNFDRFKKWNKEGYNHPELYQFIYGLLKYFTDNNISLGRNNITIKELEAMHKQGTETENTYKFKFK